MIETTDASTVADTEIEMVSTSKQPNVNVRLIGSDGGVIIDCKSEWSDLYLPDDTKETMQTAVSTFLSSRDFYESNRLPWKTGWLLHGERGTGKTTTIRTIISNHPELKSVSIDTLNEQAVEEAFMYAEDNSPSLLFFEDLDFILENAISTYHFIELMDSIVAKFGVLVIATVPSLDNLPEEITERPSRFERKFEMPLPDDKMASKFLKREFGTSITSKKRGGLVKKAIKHRFSFADLKELYINSMFECIAKGRQTLEEADIDTAMTKIIKDKQPIIGVPGINLDAYKE